MVGENIRRARLGQRRSLADVAKKAKISIATLSRIENEKQALELGLFLTLAKVLECTPTDLLSEPEAGSGEGLEPLVKKISMFEAGARAKLWRELANARRTQRAKARRARIQHLADQVDELLAQIDCMREELEILRRRLRRPAAASR